MDGCEEAGGPSRALGWVGLTLCLLLLSHRHFRRTPGGGGVHTSHFLKTLTGRPVQPSQWLGDTATFREVCTRQPFSGLFQFLLCILFSLG